MPLGLVGRLKRAVAMLLRRLGKGAGRRPASLPDGVFERPTPRDDLISVVLAGAGDEAAWSRAARAVLAQEHRALELLIVDGSPAGVGAAVAERLRAADERVRVLRCLRPCGDSWAFNLGLMYARGRLAALQEPEAALEPSWLASRLAELRSNPEAVVVTSDPDHLGSCLFCRDVVLERVGFFDSVLRGGGQEWLARLRSVLAAGVVVDEASCSAATPIEREDPVSPAYVNAYRAWHAEGQPFMEFPLRRRPFAAPRELLDAHRSEEDFVTASLASIPSRREGLEVVVRSLLGQVDQLNVFLNHYEDVPDFLHHPRVRVARSQEHGDLRDNGKFFFLGDAEPGYVFTVDDDILYPEDYVARLLAKLRQYDDRAVVGYHGAILSPQLRRFFAPGGRSLLHFRFGLAFDRQVHLLGTGTTAWHTSRIALSREDFETTGMADIWLGVRAQQAGVPMIAVEREPGYLRPVVDLDERSLYREFVNSDKQQTQVVLQHQPWQMPPLSGGATAAGRKS